MAKLKPDNLCIFLFSEIKEGSRYYLYRADSFKQINKTICI